MIKTYTKNIVFSLLLSAFGSKSGSESVCLINFMQVSEAGGNFPILLFLQSRFDNHSARSGHPFLFKEE